MSDQKKSSTLALLDGLVETLKFLIITLIVYFIIGAGWNGLYDWYARLKGEKPDGQTGERIGKRAFGLFCIGLIIQVIIIANLQGDIDSVILFFLGLDGIFLAVSMIGFIYFWATLDRKD